MKLKINEGPQPDFVLPKNYKVLKVLTQSPMQKEFTIFAKTNNGYAICKFDGIWENPISIETFIVKTW